jgi:hypothetical protein
MSVEMVKAIKSLVPNAEFSLDGDDYSTIQWDVLEGKAPTQKEVDAAIEKVKADQVAEKAQAQADKETAQAKLTALGLTADELKAIGL